MFQLQFREADHHADADKAQKDQGADLKAIPKSRKQAIAGRFNATLAAIVLTGTFFQLFGLPLALNQFGEKAVWLLLPIMLLQPIHWGLIHEAIHGRLFAGSRANRVVIPALSISAGIPFEMTRFSHLVHHRFSRHAYDRTDIHNGKSPYIVAWFRYWGRLFGGVYLGILTSPLIACLPRRTSVRLMEMAIPIMEPGDLQVRRLFTTVARNDTKRRHMRRDFFLVIALYGLSIWAYGKWWPVFLATVYVRGLWHSLADNVAHHGVALHEPERARNYTLPRFWRLILMNQNLHLTHHLHPHLPWSALPAASMPEGECRRESYFVALLRQINFSYPRPASACTETAAK